MRRPAEVDATGPTHPPAGLAELRVWTIDDASQLAAMRAELFQTVTGQVMAARFTLGGVADRMVLVASELAANAIGSGSPPATVRLCHLEPVFVLDVANRDVRVQPEPAEEWAPAEGKLWLRMARRLSSEVGWHVAGDAKHVWARFDADQPEFE